jgi:hypothetical protein
MPYIQRTLNLGPDGGDPTYRMSMLPFGTYPNADGSGEHLGFAVPGMISEPANALMRLIGTPGHPGTFGHGPDVGIAWDNPVRSEFPNQQDMTTLLATTIGGGNAARGMAAEARALPALADATAAYRGNAPSLGATLSGAKDQLQAAYRTVRHPFASSTVDDPAALNQWEQIARLQQEIRAMENRHAAETHLLRLIDTGNGSAPLGSVFNDEFGSSLPLSSYDTAALNQLLRRRAIDSGALYANGLPSLWSSALPSQMQPNPQPSDGLPALGAYRRGGFVRAA